jgi:nicotinate phosphoribosyltransferase
MNGVLDRLYRPTLSLLVDLYELTMAYGYWKAGVEEREGAFHLLFRENPFHGGYAVACGLATAVEYIERFRFDDTDLAYLAEIRGPGGKPMFPAAFLDYLGRLKLACDIDAVPEGTMVFANEPLVRVTGPLIHGQIVETALSNAINFQTLVATKASRVASAAGDDPVFEFGLRRAQGFDGGLSASRAAYVGGCAGTSNVLAGQLFGIPVMGTHAHSWVSAFEDELDAFRRYADALPDNCVFLVDTYNTLDGVRRAVEVGRRLRSEGHELLGIRLDSGDLAFLSIEARKILDDGGFPRAVIVGSNDLDEHLITSLKQQGAAINVWGVGTRLVTAFDDPALGGVYKLTAVRDPGRPWQGRVKLSELAAKVSTPGVLAVRRFYHDGQAVGDMIYDEGHPPHGDVTLVDPADATRRKTISAQTDSAELLTPIFRQGRRIYELPALADIRQRVRQQLARFHPAIKRFANPHQYPVGLEAGLHQRKTVLILRLRELSK